MRRRRDDDREDDEPATTTARGRWRGDDGAETTARRRGYDGATARQRRRDDVGSGDDDVGTQMTARRQVHGRGLGAPKSVATTMSASMTRRERSCPHSDPHFPTTRSSRRSSLRSSPCFPKNHPSTTSSSPSAGKRRRGGGAAEESTEPPDSEPKARLTQSCCQAAVRAQACSCWFGRRGVTGGAARRLRRTG